MIVAPLLVLALDLAALVDIGLRRPDQASRTSRILWSIIVILLPLFGAVVWFAVGRRYVSAASRRPHQGTIVVHESPAASTPPTPPKGT